MRDVTRSMYLRIKSLGVLSTLPCFRPILHVMLGYEAGEEVPRHSRFNKLMSGSSLEGKAFFLRSHKTLNSLSLPTLATFAAKIKPSTSGFVAKYQ